MTMAQLRDLITSIGDLRAALRRADVAADKAALYQALRLRMTYRHQTNSVRVKAELGPDAVGIECLSEDQLGR
jgi:hypothetical protein